MSFTLPFSGTGPLILFVAKATLLLVAALVATASLRRSTAGARHLIWLTALVGVLALPVLSRVQSLHLGILPSSLGLSTAIVDDIAVPAIPPVAALPAVPVVPAVAPIAPRPARLPIARPGIAPAARPAMPTPVAIASPMPIPVPRVARPTPAPRIVTFQPPPVASWLNSGWDYSFLTTALVVWFAVATALLGWLVAGAMSVRRIVRTARELTTPDWTMPLCEVADRLDLELPPRLVISDRIEMAFACRALSPTIVLPAAAESWTDDRRRAVLFHELAHVKRHDLIGHTLGRVACALYWFHPLVWTAAKHLRAESERACDDLVLSCGARPSEYAQHLLDMVTSVRNHGAPIMALPMARKKEFEGRMLAILDPAIRRASPGPLQTVGLVASLALLSVCVAAVAPAAATPVDSAVIAMTPPRASMAPRVAPATRPRIELPVVAQSGDPSASPSPSPSPTPSPSPSFSLNAAINAVARTALSEANGAIDMAIRMVGKQAVSASAIQQGGDSSRVALLIKILETDADANVRKTAAWGLNEIQAANARVVLTKALRNDTDAGVREMAAWALADHESDDVTSALTDALTKDKNVDVRSTAAWALGTLGARKAQSALESGIVDANAEVRETSIWALGQLGLRTAPGLLTNALTDSSQPVRLVAAWALGEMADKTTVPAVIKAFQSETDSEIRAAELRALSAMDAASPAVVDIALKSTDPEVRKRAVSMLVGHGAGNWNWPWPRPRPRPNPE